MKLFAIYVCGFCVLGAISSAPSPFALTSLTLLQGGKKAGCVKMNPCRCIMMDGSGVINLGALGGSDGYLERLKPVRSENGQRDARLLLSFSPCLPVSEPEDFESTDCLGVAACLIIEYPKFKYRYMDYGRHEGNVFEYNTTYQTLTVTYWASPRAQHQTKVHYHCSPSQSVTVIHHPWADGALEVWVDSPCACPNSCSLEDVGPGTILLIIICLSTSAYFILGSCALHPFRTHSGMQIAPKDNLWCGLCHLFTESRGQRAQRQHPL